MKKEPYEQENLCPEFGDIDGEFCKTSFEYNVCGNKNRECSDQGKGERSAYKEKGLKVIVKKFSLRIKRNMWMYRSYSACISSKKNKQW